jgi:L,D-transpeptidase ErfK/SrfK
MKREQTIRLAVIMMIACAKAHAEIHAAGLDDRKRIVVSIPDRKLVLMRGDLVMKMYDIAVGKPSTPSPEGEFQIAGRLKNPTYYAPGKVIGPGKSNPLGSRWMSLGYKGYGIHGTNEPRSIGKASSHGCIRMRQRDLEELYELVNTGTTVELHGERPAVVAMIFAITNVIAD